MEERIGLWWHKTITRLANTSYPQARVPLDDMIRPITLLFHAAGGPVSVKVVPVSDSSHSGPRAWLQRIAGAGLRAAQPRLDVETLALPPELAVFPETELNRDLYLWLAALAAVSENTGDWIADNRAATARALQRFAGLRGRHQRLLQAHLLQRPTLSTLRGEQALQEAAVQAALRGDDHTPLFVQSHQVSPVWLWLTCSAGDDTRPGRAMSADRSTADSDEKSSDRATDRRRRRTNYVEEPNPRRALILPSKVESIMSWSERVKMDRATDDEDDPHATQAANDMDTLSLTQTPQTTAARVRFDLDLPSAAEDDLPLGPGLKTPEWDWRKKRLLPDHCAIECVVARHSAPFVPTPILTSTAQKIRRRLEVMKAAPRLTRRQLQGDLIDTDAWVRYQVERISGHPATESPPVYAQRRAAERSLATLLLADLSLSTDAYATPQARVIDVIRDSLYVFGEAIAATGDPFAILGFSSIKRHHVRIQHLKGFEEPWNDTVRSRVGAIRPGYYTRMGAGIRDATRRLKSRPERQRLLLVLTDGKPNDLDIYEGRYGLEDTRHAIMEARQAGLVPFCVTIDEQAHTYLPTLFGQRGYTLVHRPQELANRLTQAWLGLVH